MTVNFLITTYNHEKYIDECIASALDQTYKKLKIIVVDAGSTDNTNNCVKKYNKFIQHFKLKNSSPSNTLNYGIQKTHGDYIAFQSGDDISHVDRVSKQVEKIKSEKGDLIFSNCDFINNQAKKIICPKIFERQSQIESLTNIDLFNEAFNKGNFFCAPSAMIKREIFNKIGMFNPLYFQLQDYDYWLRALLNNLKISFINEKLIFYRIHDKNLSSPINDYKMNDELSMVLFNILKKYFYNKNCLHLRDIFSQYIETSKKMNKFSIIEIHNILKNHRNDEVRKFAKFLFFINIDKVTNKNNIY